VNSIYLFFPIMIKDRLKELQAVSSFITILFVGDMNKFIKYEK